MITMITMNKKLLWKIVINHGLGSITEMIQDMHEAFHELTGGPETLTLDKYNAVDAQFRLLRSEVARLWSYISRIEPEIDK